MDAYLERSAFSAPPTDRIVEVRLGPRESSGWRAVVRVLNSAGTLLGDRELVSSGALCSTLDEPLTLAVALMVDSEMARSSAAAAREPKPAVRRSRPKPRKAESESGAGRSADEPASEASLWLDAGVVGATGLLPDASVGLEAGLSVDLRRWLGLRAHLVGLLPRSSELQGQASVRFGLLFGGVLACPSTRAGRIQYAVCIGGEAGAMTVAPDGFDTGETVTRSFLALSGGPRVRIAASDGFSVAATVQLLVRHRPERFVYALDGENRIIAEVSRVSGFAGVGAAFDL